MRLTISYITITKTIGEIISAIISLWEHLQSLHAFPLRSSSKIQLQLFYPVTTMSTRLDLHMNDHLCHNPQDGHKMVTAAAEC